MIEIFSKAKNKKVLKTDIILLAAMILAYSPKVNCCIQTVTRQ